MRVEVSAAFDAFYAGYFLRGIAGIVGRRNIRFVAPAVATGSHGLAATIDGRRVFFDASDSAALDPDSCQWCDIYAKVNPAAPLAPRVIAAGPSFGIRYGTLRHSAHDYLMSIKAMPSLVTDREHVANFYRQFRYRRPEDELRPTRWDSDYVFHASGLWAKEPRTNESRAAFMRAVMRLPDTTFDGGFAPRRLGSVEGFEDLLLEERLSYAEYLQRTRRSAFVFNTPAVNNCHGWKLGEYLALGKAIITTPITRALPAPLEHGCHVHVVDGTADSIRDAVERMARDSSYRASLGVAARTYYEAHVSPAAAVSASFRAAM